MKISIKSLLLALVVQMILMGGCAPAPTPVPLTLTPSPTPVPFTFTPSPAPIPPTFTPEPASTQSNITIFEAPGNLESTQDIGCAPISDLKNTYTPPDLYNGMVECINQDNYSSAVFFFSLAGVYARYDTYRVADVTAHDAKDVLIQQSVASLDIKQRNSFAQDFSKFIRNPNNLTTLCEEILRIGAPQYYPRYMIQHGMNAFTGGNSENELVKNFDSEAAWKEALDSYLHCPNLTPSPQ